MSQVNLLQPTDLKDFLQKEQPFLLDVRTMDEFRGKHLEGAVNIPLDALPYKLEEVPRDRSVLVYCLHGMRSGKAAAFLVAKGYAKITMLDGGMDALEELERPAL